MPERRLAVLLVEDDDALRSVLARRLRASGYAVSEAASAEEVERVLQERSPLALVLLDINLPGDTGWDLLRRRLLGSGAPPVVVMTAVTVNPRRLAEFNVAGYLPKPFPIETLLAIVERLARPTEEAARA